MSTELALSVHFRFCVSLVILAVVVEIENEEQAGVIYGEKEKDPLCLQNQFILS